MAEQEVDLLGEAVANTEKEIFGEAIDINEVVQDETGDTTPEEMGEGLEGQVEAKDEGDEPEAVEPERDPKTGQFAATEKTAKGDEPVAPDPKAETKPGEAEPRLVPSGRLREEAQKRQAAEDRYAAAEAARVRAESSVAELSAKFDGILAAMRTQAQPPQAKPEARQAPDMFTDPEGYARYVEDMANERVAAVEQSMSMRLVDSSLAAAHEAHGEKFEAAYRAVTSLDRNDPGARVTVQKIWHSPNPGAALMNWHRQIETIREVGSDPSAYAEKIRTQTREALLKDPAVRQQILDELRAEASGADGGKARHTTRLPKSLNGAGSAMGETPNARLYDNSERSVFEDAIRG